MRHHKLPGSCAFGPADDADELTCLRELHDPGIAIAVRDIDIAVGPESDVIHLIEQVPGRVVAGDALLSQGHQ